MRKFNFFMEARKHIEPPGINGTVIEVRVSNHEFNPTYDKTIAFMNDDLIAKAKAFDSLLQMILGSQEVKH